MEFCWREAVWDSTKLESVGIRGSLGRLSEVRPLHSHMVMDGDLNISLFLETRPLDYFEQGVWMTQLSARQLQLDKYASHQ